MVQHGQLLDRMRRFEERYAFTLCAVNQVPPFDAALDWPKEIAGVAMEHYIAWQKSCYWITATFRPAISVPAGFTPEGCPSASRSSAAIATTSACCSSGTRSSRRRKSACGGRRSSRRDRWRVGAAWLWRTECAMRY